MNEAARGKKSLENKQYEEAIAHYTAALAITPSPDYLIQRSTAYLRGGQPARSLVDAEKAVLAAQKRAKRELIIEAQFRRGCAFYQLGRYGDAKFVFEIVKRMDDKHKLAPAWAQKTVTALQKLAEDDPKRQCSVQVTPNASDSDDESEKHTNGIAAVATTKDTEKLDSTVTPATVAQTPADKIRHEWYQNSDNIYFSLLVKGVAKEDIVVDLQKRSLSISFPLVSGSSYDFTLDPLFAEVNTERSITRILPAKIEIILVKVLSGQKWSALESKDPVDGVNGNSDKTVTSATQTQTAGPVYPTSSKTGAKDWDKVTKEASAKLRDPSKAGSAGDDDDDFEGGDEANHFFQKLFKDASPEVRRAMMKSYTESNGTALSTNWDEVSKAKVETVPPDGMEARQWEK